MNQVSQNCSDSARMEGARKRSLSCLAGICSTLVENKCVSDPMQLVSLGMRQNCNDNNWNIAPNAQERRFSAFTVVQKNTTYSTVFRPSNKQLNFEIEPSRKERRRSTSHGPYLTCCFCQHTFPTEEQLIQHGLQHIRNENNPAYGGKKLSMCPICGKEFAKNAHLTSHLRIHTGERPFGCDVCGKKFTQKSTLNRHSRVHTGEKPFRCTICSKSFAQQSTLSSHERTHEIEPGAFYDDDFEQ